MKMLGRKARVCDDKHCTDNPGNTRDRRFYKRLERTRERRQWKKEQW